MRTAKTTFPNGLKKALTLSFDDCVLQDRRFVHMLNKYNLKCTFNINSGWFGQVDFIGDINHSHIFANEVKSLYQNHEVAVHSVNHPCLTNLSDECLKAEILDDKAALEALVGYEITGMAYPGGTWNEALFPKLKNLGIEYARTIDSHGKFNLPDRPMAWHPTISAVDQSLMTLTDKFIELQPDEPALFYVWGHSYEFDAANGWDRIEEFCSKISGKNDIWYATNIEIIHCCDC